MSTAMNPAAGAAPLRPMSVGQILDRTINLYRNHFILFFGIAALPSALWLAVQLTAQLIGEFAGIDVLAGNESAFMIAVVVGGIALIVYLLGYALAMAATIHAVSSVHLGRNISIRESYERLRGRVGRLINVMLSVVLRVFGGAFFLIMLGTLVSGAAIGGLALLGPWGAVLGAVIAFVAMIAAALLSITLFVRYSVAVQACVLENIKARQALKRSVILTKGRRARILGIWMVVVVLTYVVMIPLVFPVALIAGSGSLPQWLGEGLNHLVGFFAGTLVAPIGAIALSLVYYDERVRREAFDIELMMASADQPASPAGLAEAQSASSQG